MVENFESYGDLRSSAALNYYLSTLSVPRVESNAESPLTDSSGLYSILSILTRIDSSFHPLGGIPGGHTESEIGRRANIGRTAVGRISAVNRAVLRQLQ